MFHVHLRAYVLLLYGVQSIESSQLIVLFKLLILWVGVLIIIENEILTLPATSAVFSFL